MVASALIDLSQVSVLCVDDDPVMRTVVRAALNQRGCCDMVQATDGEKALDLCTGRRFDLIICDFHMTPMDGHGFLRELGQRGLGKGRPVVMLSADNDPAAIAEAQALGVHAWLVKPISARQLVEHVGTVLGLGGDSAVISLSERHHAKLMADVASLQELLASLPYRERDRPGTWRAMWRLLHGMSGQADMDAYALVRELARRGADLLRATEHNPALAAAHHSEIAQAITSITTAIRRVAQNRMLGDGGDVGVTLLSRLDGFIAPLRVSLQRGVG